MVTAYRHLAQPKNCGAFAFGGEPAPALLVPAAPVANRPGQGRDMARVYGGHADWNSAKL